MRKTGTRWASDSDLKLLLDTHIWLWSLLDPGRLPKRIARTLAAARTGLWISPVTTWETLTLCQRGRLSLEPDPRTWIAAAREAVPIHDAPLNHEVLQPTVETTISLTLTCGIGKQEGDQILKILNKVLADRIDPEAVIKKL